MQIASQTSAMLEGTLIRLALASAVAVAGSLENASEIIRRSVIQTEGNWRAAPNYSCVRTTSKNKPGHPPSILTHEVLMIDGSPYLKLMAQDGHPLSAAAAREEEQKLQKETEHRSKESPRERAQRLRKFTDDRARDHNLLTAISDAFDYKFADGGQTGAGSAWVLEGRPKPSYVPANRDAKVLSNMNVRIWIDKASYQWVRLEAEITQPVSLYGLAKVMPGTRFSLEQEPVSATVWLPKHFTMEVNAFALGLIHEDYTEEESYSRYAPVPMSEAGDLSRKPATAR